MDPNSSEKSPKHSMDKAEGDSELSLYEAILQVLECPVCYNYLSPPLGQCVQGHVICPSCYDRLERCPVCRGAKSQASALLLESIHSVIPLPCKYEQLGCKTLIKGKDMKCHEKLCPFAPMHCPLCPSHCNWEGTKDDVVDHLKRTHPDRIICNDTQNFFCKNVLDNNQVLMVVLFYTSETLFRAYWEFDKRLELMKFSVCQLDRSKSKEEFFYSISVLNIHTKEESVKMMTKCYIPNDLEEDIFQNKQFVAVHYDILRKYSNDLGDVKYKIEIFKQDRLSAQNSLGASLSMSNEVQLL